MATLTAGGRRLLTSSPCSDRGQTPGRGQRTHVLSLDRGPPQFQRTYVVNLFPDRGLS